MIQYPSSHNQRSVKKVCISNSSVLSFVVVFHFHDHGRKGKFGISVFKAILNFVTDLAYTWPKVPGLGPVNFLSSDDKSAGCLLYIGSEILPYTHIMLHV